MHNAFDHHQAKVRLYHTRTSRPSVHQHPSERVALLGVGRDHV